MQDFSELFSKGLLPLQVLSRSVRRTRQRLQKAFQCFLYMKDRREDTQSLRYIFTGQGENMWL